MAKKSLSDSISPILEKIEQLTKVQRIAICVVTFTVLIGCFVGFSYWGKIEQIGKLEKDLSAELKKLETARRNAAMLDSYRKKMEDARERFEVVKRALPEREEIPSLLAGISKTGRDAGLEFLLFQPNQEVAKEFYAEIPVSISVIGNYHEVATFFSNVANMSRIVNIDNVNIDPGSKGGGLENDLTTKCTAITYKFIEAQKKKK